MYREIIENDPEPWDKLLELENSGLLREEFPELSALDYSSGSHKNNFFHTLQVLKNVVLGPMGQNPVLRWAAVLHDIGKPGTAAQDENGHWTFWNHNVVGSQMVPGILHRFSVNRSYWGDISDLVYLHMRPVSLAQEPVTDSAVRRVMTEAKHLLGPLMELAEADITSKNRSMYIGNIKKVRSEMQRIQEADYWESLRPVCNGDWLMREYPGITGEHIGIIKEELKKALNQGCPNTFEALVPLVRRIYGQL